MHYLDTFLNGISMYRLMQWYLRFLFGIAVILSFLKILPYKPIDILISGFYIIVVCYITNQLFAYFFKVKPNYESQFITGLILALIIGPLPLLSNLFFLTITPFIAMASKYLIVINKQHIFNPAAAAIAVTAVLFHSGASWWIGSLPMSAFIMCFVKFIGLI
jgi:glycine betaine catabolism B